MKRRAALPILVAVVALLATSAGSVSAEETPKEKTALEKLVGGSLTEALAGVRLRNLEGETVSLASYLGKGPVVFDFWATWCKPCLAAMPELDKLYEDLAPRGLTVVGINEDGPRNASKIKPFMRSHGYDFPVVFDFNRVAQRRLNAVTLPTTLVLDADGRVVHTSFGYRPGEIDKLREVIEPLLIQESDE